MNLLVCTTVPPLSLTNAIRRRLQLTMTRMSCVTGIQTVDDLMDASRAQPRFVMLLLAIFSATAFVLAAIGLYGVLAYAVAQRRRELAIRIALGAGQENILAMVVRQGLLLAATGIVIGLAAAAFLTRLMKSLLFETGALDVTTFVLAPIGFVLIALLASDAAPTRRATKVDPLDALASHLTYLAGRVRLSDRR